MKYKAIKYIFYMVLLLAAAGLCISAGYFLALAAAQPDITANQTGTASQVPIAAPPSQTFQGSAVPAPYDDVITGPKADALKDMDLSGEADVIPTLTFSLRTVWPSKMPAGCDPVKILEAAKNPGLGVRALHTRGITGRGVNVAIIDQPLYQDHPEFADKIKVYKDFGCATEYSMHGPAVASLLVGTTTGTAPGANLYYAAAPMWLRDSEYMARALDWIVEESAGLPEKEKIRVVSVSAAPSGEVSPFALDKEKWDEAVARAKKEGILVLDCTKDNNIIFSCFLDKGDPELPSSYTPGFPYTSVPLDISGRICVPTSPRTTAEEHMKGDFSYQYTGQGGMSWAIPYCAGVLAMGWQVNPGLTADRAVELMFKSAYKTKYNALIIDPPAFVKLTGESLE